MNVLVTGADGQLGNEMRRVAADSMHRYVFTDVAQLDITDREAVGRMMSAESVDIIVNWANLASAAAARGASLIHVSTDYVFDGNHCTPYREDEEPGPTGVYGMTKLAGERAIEASGCRHIILRTAWLYSRWGKNFLKTMLRLTAERDTLGVVFDQVGTPTYAGDLADAVGWIIDGGMYDRQGIYHFTDEGVCSWYDFAVAIARAAGHDCDIRPLHSDEYPAKVRRPSYSVLDKSKFRSTFGFRPPYWADSMIKCINLLKTDNNGQL